MRELRVMTGEVNRLFYMKAYLIIYRIYVNTDIIESRYT